MNEMSVNCPLPVDLLDYLDGSLPDLHDHVNACLACQEAITRLSPFQSVRLDTSKFIGVPVKAWTVQPKPQATIGDVWLSAHDFTQKGFAYQQLDGLPFLVLSEQRDDEFGRWVDAVPIWPDVENATNTDLILSGTDITLTGSFRAVFDLQIPIEIDQLAGHIGSLTEQGIQLLHRVFDGELSDAHFGPRLESDTDPRLDATDWIRQIAREVSGYYSYCHDVQAVSFASTLSHLDVIGTFRLSAVERAPVSHSHLLAARTVPGQLVRRATLVTDKGLQIDARLSYHIDAGDVLRLEVVGAAGFRGAVRVIAVSGQLKIRAASDSFRPAEGTTVDFAKGQGMLLRFVDSLELVHA